MFLVLEVSAMVVTGLVAITSMSLEVVFLLSFF